MKKFTPFSFQHKVILLLILFMNAPFFITGYMAKDLTEQTILREKEVYLQGLTQILNSRLGPGGYAAILQQAGAQDASREVKIRVLNHALAASTDEVGTASPGLGAGYYSRELDTIITYGPSASFGDNVGVSIPQDHPGRIMMNTNTPLVRSGTMVRGDIMNAMRPIERTARSSAMSGPTSWPRISPSSCTACPLIFFRSCSCVLS